MSFYYDWIERGMDLLEAGAKSLRMHNRRALYDAGITSEDLDEVGYELAILKVTMASMLDAKIIKLPDSQLEEFMTVPLSDHLDYTLVRSPYTDIYMEVNPPLPMGLYWDDLTRIHIEGVRVHALMISELSPTELDHDHAYIMGEHRRVEVVNEGKSLRGFRSTLFLPLPGAPENTFIATFHVTLDGKLWKPAVHAMDLKTQAEHKVYVDMSIHIMNYLTSPSIMLERKEHDAALQRARIKRGRGTLKDWYEIRYSKTIAQPTGLGPSGFHHSFRYDVRGHFAHIKKGRLAGRSIWIPAHQRGLANQTYRPKVYTLGKGQ